MSGRWRRKVDACGKDHTHAHTRHERETVRRNGHRETADTDRATRRGAGGVGSYPSGEGVGGEVALDLGTDGAGALQPNDRADAIPSGEASNYLRPPNPSPPALQTVKDTQVYTQGRAQALRLVCCGTAPPRPALRRRDACKARLRNPLPLRKGGKKMCRRQDVNPHP
jgi:hypothetical protein